MTHEQNKSQKQQALVFVIYLQKQLTADSEMGEVTTPLWPVMYSSRKCFLTKV